jgi:hypothetical protein
VAERGDGAYVATITLSGQLMCRITRSSASAEAARAEAKLHAEQWIAEYSARGW